MQTETGRSHADRLRQADRDRERQAETGKQTYREGDKKECMLRSNKIGILNDRMTDRPIAEFLSIRDGINIQIIISIDINYFF